jgi:two-component system NtrC family response regulator
MNEASRKLLIVEDDKGLQRQLRWAFEKYEVLPATDQRSALEVVSAEWPPVVLLDLGLPPDPDGPTVGLAILEEILSVAPETKVIMMTGQAGRAHAVQAVARGAYDFYQKPVEINVLSLIVDRAYALYDLENEHQKIMSAAADGTIQGVITVNPKMQNVLEKVGKFARSDVTALILGESGTGKELIARGIHELSSRRTHRFVVINCAAIPDQLLESELFGHEKGAFTGAVKTTKGKVELADGGTLFLDEVGDLSLHLQAKILRFLQERVIERVGGREQIQVDVRVISATNKDLSSAIVDREFREDLYYRLSEVTVEIPALRERPDDAIVIANHFLQEFAREQGRAAPTFSSDALVAISGHAWPGNVRELQNRIKSAVVTGRGNKIAAEDLDLSPPGDTPTAEPLKEARDRAERHSIKNALLLANGNVSQAAKILKISRPKLYDLLRYHKLKT